jgi:hypothetical protein
MPKPDAVAVDARRDLEVGLARLEQAARMVVDEHLALLGEPGQREHAAHVAARDHARGAHDAAVVDLAGEAHLAAAGELDATRMAAAACLARRPSADTGSGKVLRTTGVGREPQDTPKGARGLRARPQVFRGFFFAAGKSTLLRIRR